MKLKSLLTAALFCAAPVFADDITLPYNTGTGYTGDLATPGLVDLHYSTVQGVPLYVESNFWQDGLPNAQWIGPDTKDGSLYDNGVYTLDYLVTFNSTGYDPSTTSLSGLVKADDHIENILVNGYSYGTFIGEAYNNLNSFTLTNGFISGLNTIDIEVSNTGGPGGILIDFTSATGEPNGFSADASATPEPASLALIGLGIAAVGLIRRKR